MTKKFSTEKTASVILVVILTVSAGLARMCIKDGHNWGGDFALYIDQAQALLNGSVDDLYLQNKYAMQHSEYEIGPYLYPFGFPLLLWPVVGLFGLNFIAFKIYCFLFFIAALFVIFQLFKPQLQDPLLGLLLIAGLAFHEKFLIFSSNVLSDLPFLFFCFLSFLLMHLSVNVLSQLALGGCIFYAYFIRDIGIALLPALLAIQYLRQKDETTAVKVKHLLIPFLVFTVLFFLSRFVFPAGTENHYRMLSTDVTAESILRNNSYYFNALATFFMGENFSVFVFYPVFVVALLGGLLHKKNAPYFLFCVITWCIIVIWPSIQGERFLFPILPFFLLFFVQGIKLILSPLKTSALATRLIFSASVLGLCCFNIPRVLAFAQANTNEAATPELKKIYAHISENTEQDDLIAFFKPQVLRLFTGRNAIFVRAEHFSASPAKYLLTERGDPGLPGDSLEVLYASGEFVLLGRKGPTTPTAVPAKN